MSLQRIYAVILRHLFNFRRNYDRLVDAFYWPALDIVVYGLTFSALEKQGELTQKLIESMLFAVILWYVIWRGQIEITVNVLEEFWSDNLLNLMSSPLKISEWIIGLLSIGIIKLVMTVLFTAVVAMALYSANVLTLGWWFLFFVVSLLIFGWSFGFFVGGLFLRFGTSIQTLAWAGGFILMPFSATFYPLASLPDWVQKISSFLPSTYVFEGVRSLMQTGSMPYEWVGKILVLDGILFIAGVTFFFLSYSAALKKGLNHVK